MYKLLEKNSFIGYLLYIFIYVLIGIQLFKGNNYIGEYKDTFILSNFIDFNSFPYFSKFIIQFLILIIIGIGDFVIFKNLSFSSRPTLTYKFIFACTILFVLSFQHSLLDIIELFIVYIYLINFLACNKLNQTMSVFFNIGFICGISLLISLHFIIIIPILLFGINIFGKNSFNDLSAFILGVLSTLYISFSLFYIFEFNDYISKYAYSINYFDYSLLKNFSIILLILTLLFSITSVPIISNFNISTRKFYTVLFGFAIVFLPFSLFFSYNHSKSLITIAYILSFYLSAYISNKRTSKIKNLFLFSIFIVSIVSTFVTLIQ